jgi:hypothetical protein
MGSWEEMLDQDFLAQDVDRRETTEDYRNLLDWIVVLPKECVMCSATLDYAWEGHVAVGTCHQCRSYTVRSCSNERKYGYGRAYKYRDYRLDLPRLEALLTADTFELKLRLSLKVIEELKLILGYAKDGIFSISRVREFLDDASEKCRSHWDIIIRTGLVDHMDRESRDIMTSN